MKRDIFFSGHRCFFAIMAIGLGALTGYSQGVVNFNNSSLSEPPDRRVYCLEGPLAGTNFVAQLMYGNLGAESLTPHTGTVRFRPADTTQPGFWNGASRTLTGVGGVGTTINLQVRIWNSDFGATFNEARANGGFWGESQMFTYTEGPLPADKLMHNFQGFTILQSCVPEPSVALLLLPIIGVLWLWRTRKA